MKILPRTCRCMAMASRIYTLIYSSSAAQCDSRERVLVEWSHSGVTLEEELVSDLSVRESANC